jgi:hypothetical protein
VKKEGVNMKIKKVISIAAAFVLALTLLAGCNSAKTSGDAADNTDTNADKTYLIKLTSADPITTYGCSHEKRLCADFPAYRRESRHPDVSQRRNACLRRRHRSR